MRRIDAEYQASDQLVRTESAKHRQAVASVISWVSVALLFVVVAVEITDILAIPVGSLVAPAAVLGAALGFGAQRIVQDLLSGFFIITEKQYGFGDLVALTVAGIDAPAEGTVEDVTLRVTKLRSTEGEMFTIPNGQIVKTLNLSKDWARAVIDIPVPTSADLNLVHDVLHDVSEKAMEDPSLQALLLDKPQMMGVESIELDTVNLRMVARTLPGKQFEVGRRIRVLVVRALRRAGIVSPPTARPRWSRPSCTRRPQAAPRKRPRGRRSRRHDQLAEGQVRPHAGLDDCAHRRVRRAVLGARGIPVRAPGPGGARACGRPAWLRPGPELHLGAAHERAAAQGAHHHDHHDEPDGHHDDEPHVTDGDHPDDDRGGSRRSRAEAADDADDCHADSGDHHADLARPDTDDDNSGKLGLRSSPATLACRVDVLPRLAPGIPTPPNYVCGRRAELRFTVRRPASAEVSPCCHRPPGGDVACNDHVGIAPPCGTGFALDHRLALAVFERYVPPVSRHPRNLTATTDKSPKGEAAFVPPAKARGVRAASVR